MTKKKKKQTLRVFPKNISKILKKKKKKNI